MYRLMATEIISANLVQVLSGKHARNGVVPVCCPGLGPGGAGSGSNLQGSDGRPCLMDSCGLHPFLRPPGAWAWASGSRLFTCEKVVLATVVAGLGPGLPPNTFDDTLGGYFHLMF